MVWDKGWPFHALWTWKWLGFFKHLLHSMYIAGERSELEKNDNNKNIVAAFREMHVSPAKHSYARPPRKCDYRTDTQTDRQTDRRRTKWSLCAAMLRRRHNKTAFGSSLLLVKHPHMTPSLTNLSAPGRSGPDPRPDPPPPPLNPRMCIILDPPGSS